LVRHKVHFSKYYRNGPLTTNNVLKLIKKDLYIGIIKYFDILAVLRFLQICILFSWFF
jgi:hypothetical protein